MRRWIGAAMLAAGWSVAGADAAISQQPFGETADGHPIVLYTLTAADGFEAQIATYGATLVTLKAPDRHGQYANVVLGFDNGAAYVKGGPFFGATIGRYANRIAGGTFTLDGQTYHLPLNNGPNTLHGGRGFDKRLWQAEAVDSKGGPRLTLTYVSADGEEGFPGALTTTVTYTLAPGHALSIRYRATTTKPTVVNFTNHSYFNLSGNGMEPITAHRLTLKASRFTPVGPTSIPTGELRPVAGTPFDFRTPTVLGAHIADPDPQIAQARGYDHNWVLDSAGGLGLAATLEDPVSGRVLEVLTTEPGIQVYTANSPNRRPDGTVFPAHAAVCLETQHFPDAPNQPSFPSTVLRPGAVFQSETVFRFRAEP